MTRELAALMAQVIPVLILALIIDARQRMKDAQTYLADLKKKLADRQQQHEMSQVLKGAPGQPKIPTPDAARHDANVVAWAVFKLGLGQSIVVVLLGYAEYAAIEGARRGDGSASVAVVMIPVMLGLFLIVAHPVRDFLHGPMTETIKYLWQSASGKRLVKRDLLMWGPIWLAVVAIAVLASR